MNRVTTITPQSTVPAVSHTSAPAAITPIAPSGNVLGGFSFGGATGAKVAKKGKTQYPVVSDPNNEITPVAAQYRADKESFEALEGALKSGRMQLIQFTAGQYFAACRGLADAPSSIVVNTPEGEVRVTYPDKYSIAQSAEAVVSVVGQDVAQKHFKQAFEIKIKGDELPETDITQTFLTKLYELATSLGLVNAVEFKQSVKPRKGWNKARHMLLTPEQNLALESVCPTIPTINTKGRE